MTKQAINVGTTANDKKGDSLRAAFQKVNANFTELYEAVGLADTGQDTALTFLGSTLSTDDSSSIVIDRATTVTSNLSVGGDIVPQTANGGDLGSSTLPWRSLYVSNNTIYIGGTAVGVDANGQLTVSGSQVNAPSSTLVNGSNTVSLDANGNITFPQGTLLGYSDPGGFIINGAVDKDIAIYTYNGADAHGWTFGTDGSLTLPGDIRSEGNINIDINLTDSTLRRWRFGEDGDTVFPNNVSINYSGNNIQFPRIIADSGKAFSVQGQGSTGSAALSWTVDPDAAGQYAAVSVSRAGGDNLAKVLLSAQSDSSDAATARTWVFNENGTLTLPGGSTIAEVGPGGVLQITPRGAASYYQSLWIYPTGFAEGDHLHLTAGGGSTELYLGDDDHFVKLANDGFVIIKADDGVNSAVWGFSPDGTTSIPGDIKSDSNINIDINLTDSTLRRWQFGEDGILTLPSVGKISNGAYDWTFGTDGKLTAPGNLQVNGGKIILNTGGNAYIESVDYGVNSANSAVNIFGGPYQKIKLRAGFGTEAAWTFGPDGELALPNNGKITSGVDAAQVGSTTTIALNNLGTDQANNNINVGIEWTGNEAVFTTYAAGSTITFANGDVRTITEIQKNEVYDEPGVFAIDIYWSTGTPRENLTAFPITLKTSNYAAAYTAPEWQFGTNGVLTLPGILKIDDGVHEKFQTKADATGVVTHDCSSGHIFRHTSPDANWTANFTNLNLDSTYATSITLIIAQGATGYYPSAVQIAGSAQTINWQGNVNPTVSTSRTDVVTFSIINNSGTYTVLGQLTGF